MSTSTSSALCSSEPCNGGRYAEAPAHPVVVALHPIVSSARSRVGGSEEGGLCGEAAFEIEELLKSVKGAVRRR